MVYKTNTPDIIEKWFTAARSFFSQNQKTEKFCVDRAAYFFLFFGRVADKKQTSESEANTKKHVFARRRWLQVKISKKKIFDFFAIAWLEPCPLSVRPSVSHVTLYSPNGTVLWLRNGLKI